MLTVSEVTKSYGGRVLFEEVTTSFDPGHRYGLTGANGAGKSTFMKILAGEIEPDKGRIITPPNARMSVLHQDHYRFANNTVRDVVIMGNVPLWKALDQKNKLLVEVDYDSMNEEQGMQLAELEMVIAEQDGYDAENRAEELLIGLGIEKSLHEQPLDVIQGGLRLRALLAQALFGDPDILLLDEPTNHLDLDSIRWLENFLLNFSGVLIVISHDRHFLNRVCTHTADVDYENIILYPGGYDEMMQQKVAYRIAEEKQNSSKSKKITDLQDFIRRFGANAKKAAQASSRKREVAKIRVSMVDLKRSNIQRPFIRFDVGRASGKLSLAVERLGKTFDDGTTANKVLDDVSFTLQRGDKLAVVGPNGVGKTTLIKCLAGFYESDRGKVKLGHEVSVGWMPQDHEEGLGGRSSKTAYEWLHQWDSKATVEEVRGLLGRMLFPSEDAEKPLTALSGGETVRLLLAKLTLTKNNLLLLDEPTNHLDLESIRALEESLVKYEGTLVLVAHDQSLLEEVATCVLELHPGGKWDFFPGGYADYLRKSGKAD